LFTNYKQKESHAPSSSSPLRTLVAGIISAFSRTTTSLQDRKKRKAEKATTNTPVSCLNIAEQTGSLVVSCSLATKFRKTTVSGNLLALTVPELGM
jgi:hypothetical protein